MRCMDQSSFAGKHSACETLVTSQNFQSTAQQAGPGGNMLAALGVVSSAYHLSKMLEWQAYDQERLRAASQLLSQYGGSAPPGDSPTKLNRPVPPGGF